MSLHRHKALTSNVLFFDFDRSYGWQHVINEVQLHKESSGYMVCSTDSFDLFNVRYFDNISDATKYFKDLIKLYKEHTNVCKGQYFKKLIA